MLNSDEILDRAGALKAAGQPFALATVVRAESPTAAKPGAKAIITPQGDLLGWIGGGCAQPAVLDTARKALRDGQARLIRVSPQKGAASEVGIIDFGMTCHSGGTLDIFIEPVVARPSLAIVGSSPVAQTLALLAHKAGFAVHVAAPGASEAMFPDARQCIDGLGLDQLTCGVPSYIVVATQGKRDEAALVAALALQPVFLAFVASARKGAKLKATLIARGQPAEAVNAIASPVGIDIGAITPEEVAISVLGAIIRERRVGQAGAGDANAALSQGGEYAPAAAEATSCCDGGHTDTAETIPATSCCGGDGDVAAKPAKPALSVASGCCGGSDAAAGAAPGSAKRGLA